MQPDTAATARTAQAVERAEPRRGNALKLAAACDAVADLPGARQP
jgi:hypothetical protein